MNKDLNIYVCDFFVLSFFHLLYVYLIFKKKSPWSAILRKRIQKESRSDLLYKEIFLSSDAKNNICKNTKNIGDSKMTKTSK